MAKKTLLHWIKELNNYGRLRVFLNEKDAKECQEALTQISKMIQKSRITEKFITRWWNKLKTVKGKDIRRMLKEVGVEVVEE